MASAEERKAAIENARRLVESGVIPSQAYTVDSCVGGDTDQASRSAVSHQSGLVLETMTKRQ